MNKLPALLLFVLVFILAPSVIRAQDAVTADPAHFKVQFENDEVRVVHVVQAPHEKSATHSHPASLLVFLTDIHVRFTYPDGRSEEVRGSAGQTRWIGPVTHQVENLADAPSEVLHIEIKQAHKTGKTARPGAKP
ncbi:MAG TPA: hypothetical protein VFE84_09725 [Patescibacteria group bacterium]|nr:hypothetical protein [Patescibacteria group bacterium]